MAITLVPMVCPQCHATIDAPVDKDSCFCTYCGTKILINNDSVKTININQHITDEARIEEAKTKRDRDKQGMIMVLGVMVMIIIMFLIVAIAGRSE